MDLRQMEYFVTLAAEQQFTRAATLTHVSQSGLSAAIRSLEHELGTALFTRTTRRVELTEAGYALLPYARTILAQASAGRDAVVATTQQLHGTVRVGSEQCLGVLDVVELVERFRHRYPQVDVEFEQGGSAGLLRRMHDDQLDLAFVASSSHSPGKLAGLERHEVATEPIVVLCDREHELAHKATVVWDCLDGISFVDFAPDWAVRVLNDQAAQANGIRRRVRCTVNDVHTLLDMVHRGLGIAVVPRPVASKPQAQGLSRLRLPDASTPAWVVSAVTRANGSPASIATRLLSLVPELRAENLTPAS